MSDSDDSTVGEHQMNVSEEIMQREEEPCPVCSEELNHIVANGYRNEWDYSIAKVAVCTTDDSDWMFVHVTESHR